MVIFASKSVLKDADYYPKTSQDYGRWLTNVFDGLGIRQAHVIGSSMGGWITHGFASPAAYSIIIDISYL